MPSRRHHYVPQFYLRQWTGDDRKLSQFHRPREQLYHKRVYPSETAFEPDLYKLYDVPENVTQFIEDEFLNVADQLAHDAHQQLLAGKLPLSKKLTTGWSRFIISLINRTPDRVEFIRNYHASEMAKVMDSLHEAYDLDHAKDPAPPTPEQKDADMRRAIGISFGKTLQASMDLPGVGYHLNNMHWAVYNIPIRRRPLLTSDFNI